MCKRVTCGHCGRPTYTGCGAHVEQVLGNVPVDERCKCHEAHTVAAPSSAADGEKKSWLDGLLRR